MRPPYHSKFILITNDGCNYFGYRKRYGYLGQIFYYFSTCEFANKSEFPNAFIDHYDRTNDYTETIWIKKNHKYSIHNYEPPLGKSGYGSILFVDDGTTGMNEFFYRRYCKTLTFQHPKRKTTGTCPLRLHAFNLFEKHFNLSLTWNPALVSKCSGKVIVSGRVTAESSAFNLFQFAESGYVYSELEIVFFYCKDINKLKLMSYEALVSPFNLDTWICIVSAVLLLILVGVHPANVKEISQKVLHIFRFLFEQNIEIINIWGFLIFLSMNVLVNVYKNDVTSSLLVPSKKNITALSQNGYFYMYDVSLASAINEIIEVLKLNKSRTLYSTDELTFRSISALQSLRGKVLRSSNLQQGEMSDYLSVLHAFLSNMTCTALENNLKTYWRNFVFFSFIIFTHETFYTSTPRSGSF